MNAAEPMTDIETRSSPSRLEWGMALTLLLIAAGLRLAYPSRLAVEHFDEGVYASNYFFSGEKGDERYPNQHLYAPPLVPDLIEFAMTILGPSNLVASLVGIIAGTLTVPLIWWVGRRWFGPAAGLTAATIVALSEVHILFSRTALTDVLLCFWLLLAVHCFWVSQTTGRRAALCGAGVFTGLAWWTKYSGWLPLAISISGVLAWRLAYLFNHWKRLKEDRPQMQRALRSIGGSLLGWGVMLGLAVAVWGPYWWSLQSQGGYAAVSANHRGYFGGLQHWNESLVAQARKLVLMSGPFTACAPTAGLILSLCWLRSTDRRFTWNGVFRDKQMALAIPVLGLIGAVEGGGLILAGLGIMGALVALARSTSTPVDSAEPEGDRSLAAWLLLAWLGGLLLSVPLYTTYPRLTLPLLMATWIGCGSLAGGLISGVREVWGDAVAVTPPVATRTKGKGKGRVAEKPRSRIRPILIAILAIGIVIFGAPHTPWEHPTVAWPERGSLARQVPEIRDDLLRFVGSGQRASLDRLVVYTYGEPALLFQLRLSGLAFVKPVQDLGFVAPDVPSPKIPSFVAFGPQAWRTEGFGEQLAKGLPRLQLVGKYKFQPSDIVVLDGPLIESARHPEYDIEVYFLK